MTASYADALIAEAKLHGVKEVAVENRRSHLCLRFWFGGREIMFVFAASPSDHRGIHNSLSDLRRVMGVRRLIKKAKRVPGDKGKRGGPAHASLPPLPTSFPVKPNPFDQLSALLRRADGVGGCDA